MSARDSTVSARDTSRSCDDSQETASDPTGLGNHGSEAEDATPLRQELQNGYFAQTSTRRWQRSIHYVDRCQTQAKRNGCRDHQDPAFEADESFEEEVTFFLVGRRGVSVPPFSLCGFGDVLSIRRSVAFILSAASFSLRSDMTTPILPWDYPGFPAEPDSCEEHTFEGVGRVLTAWECLEFRLSLIYAIFRGDKNGPSVAEYGENGRIFRDRISGLTSAAEKWFVAHPDQHLEALFSQITKHTIGFADRRNDVAHGIVFPVHSLTFFREAFGVTTGNAYALIPPLYAGRRHTEDGEPTYAYTRSQMAGIALALLKVQQDAETLQRIISP